VRFVRGAPHRGRRPAQRVPPQQRQLAAHAAHAALAPALALALALGVGRGGGDLIAQPKPSSQTCKKTLRPGSGRSRGGPSSRARVQGLGALIAAGEAAIKGRYPSERAQ
jgi:hypothetical protein